VKTLPLLPESVAKLRILNEETFALTAEDAEEFAEERKVGLSSATFAQSSATSAFKSLG